MTAERLAEPHRASSRTRQPITVSANQQRAAIDAYVATHPLATAYHDPRWLAVIEAAFGHQTRYLVAERDGRVVGLLPMVVFASRVFGRFVVSLPFVNAGGVLADDSDVEAALLSQAIEDTRAARGSHLELRHRRQHFGHLPCRTHKVEMELALRSTVDAQWAGLDRKVRNQIRKAEKHALQVTSGGADLLSAFYAVFAHNMRDLGTPVYSIRLFKEVLSTFSDRSRVFVVYAGSVPVAASLVHWHRNTIEVPWASALRSSNPLCANVLVYWHLLKFAVERQCRTFDFGRSTPDAGTYHFKKQWGAEPHQLVWEYWTAPDHDVPSLSPDNPRFDLAIRAWRRLPVGIATTLGPLVVRNIP
jgi:FemAB-related protein (PEP-CTERM system-associated)